MYEVRSQATKELIANCATWDEAWTACRAAELPAYIDFAPYAKAHVAINPRDDMESLRPWPVPLVAPVVEVAPAIAATPAPIEAPALVAVPVAPPKAKPRTPKAKQPAASKPKRPRQRRAVAYLPVPLRGFVAPIVAVTPFQPWRCITCGALFNRAISDMRRCKACVRADAAPTLVAFEAAI